MGELSHTGLVWAVAWFAGERTRLRREQLAELHQRGRVVTLGTVSKSLAPAVRLGWVLCTPALAEAVGDEKRRSDRGSPVIDQLAVAALIESGR